MGKPTNRLRMIFQLHTDMILLIGFRLPGISKLKVAINSLERIEVTPTNRINVELEVS